MLPSSCAVLYHTWCSTFFSLSYTSQTTQFMTPITTMATGVWPIQSHTPNALQKTDWPLKILRKIYGPVKENELWRIRWNDELEAIIKGENNVRFIKCQRIQWLGHTERMQDTAIPKKMLYGKLRSTRWRGRPKMRWLDDVSTDLRKMGINEWRDRARDREARKRTVK